MKTLKRIVLFCLAALLAGCSAHDGAETLSAKETVPSRIETAAPVTGEPSKTTASLSSAEETARTEEISLEELFANSDNNYRGLNKPPETENPTTAQGIYRALYDFADFYNYRYNYMSYFLDRSDVISVERVWGRNMRSLEDYPEIFGSRDWERYYRITGGRITTAKEYFYSLCQCASDRYLANSDRDGFETIFQLSDGNLYLTEYALNGWGRRMPASSTLDRITQIEDDRLLLELTAVTAGYFSDDEPVYTEQYTVTVSYEYGRWKVDVCEDRATDLLCNEIIEGGTFRADPKTDLPEQIERCLKESGLM